MNEETGSKIKRPLQIIVLGMHRSGTSALTGCLSEMGIYVGEEGELTSKSWENPEGFFERKDARQICDALLHRSGADWWKVSAFQAENVDFDTLREQRRAIRDLVARLDKRADGAWVLKEPRLCLLMPIFRSILSHPFAIVVIRHPLEVARSLRRRNGFSIQAGLALWEAYTVAALDNAHSVDHIVISYDELVENPQQSLEQICQELANRGVDWVDSKVGQKAIQPSLRREGPEDCSLAHLTPEQRDLWNQLEERAPLKKPPTLSKHSMDILREFEADQAGRQRLMDETRQQKEALKKINATVEEQSRALAERKSELAEAKNNTEQLASGLASAERRNAKYSSDLEQVRSELEERSIELEREQSESKSRERERIAAELQSEKLTIRLESAQSRKSELSDDLAQARTKLEERAVEIATTRSELKARGGELIEVNLQTEKLAKRLESAKSRESELSDELRQAYARLEEREGEIAAVRSEFKVRESAFAVAKDASGKMARRLSSSESRKFELSQRLEQAQVRLDELESLSKQLAELEHALAAANEEIDILESRVDEAKRRSSNPTAWPNERIELLEKQLVRVTGSRTLQAVIALQFIPLNPLRWRNRLEIRRRGQRMIASGLFDSDWYLKQYPDVRLGAKNPVSHYLINGAREGRWPHPLFDPAWYASQLGGEAFESTTPLEHYLDAAADVGASPHPWFDQAWYLKNNPDVAENGAPPLSHFLLYGGLEGRWPHPEFDSALYLERHPDVARAGINPLYHFLTSFADASTDPEPGLETHGVRYEIGAAEDSDEIPGPEEGPTNPIVHTQTEAESPKEQDDVIEAGEPVPDSPADREKRALELISESVYFDAEWYRKRYRDIERKEVDPLNHFFTRGAQEGRDPSPLFATSWYVKTYLDSEEGFSNPLAHYLEVGRAKGYKRIPSPRREAWWDKVRSVPWEADSTALEPVSRNVKDSLRRIAAICDSTCIVIPVFNAPEELKHCLESVVKHSWRVDRIIVIDDASSDPRVSELLAKFNKNSGVEVYLNDRNLGFTRTVNRGFELAGKSDVLLLNADTVVSAGWVERLQLAAYSESRVGTATPLSNNAGAFSAPISGKQNELPKTGFRDFSRAIAQTSLYRYPKSPTGNGFCMYIRRDCLAETGQFDSEAFPVGYGEENDFCMRAGAKGWFHVVDDATYIYHVRSASFGEEKKSALLKAGRAVLDQRYPQYGESAREFVGSDEMEQVRAQVARVSKALSRTEAQIKPRALYVLPTLSAQGGTPQTNQDLMQAIGDRLETFFLSCNSRSLTLFSFRDGQYAPLEHVSLAEPVSPFPHRSNQYDQIAVKWLAEYGIEIVHVRHIAFHSLGLIDMAKALSIPVIFSLHDFYTVCPTVKLLDENRTFCAGVCTKTTGDCEHDLWKDSSFPPLKNAAIYDWKKTFSSALYECDALVTTAQSAKALALENFPILEDKVFEVIPHGRDFTHFSDSPAPEIETDASIRILVPGSIGYAKGAGVLAELAAIAEDLNIEIHVLGRITEGGPIPNVVEHGAYTREEFVQRVSKIKPHLGAVFSIWPETYCHTLTELWAAGVPVIAFDFGAVAERIRATGAGWVLDEASADSVSGLIAQLRTNVGAHRKAARNVRLWQQSEGIQHGNAWMADQYQAMYDSVNPSLELKIHGQREAPDMAETHDRQYDVGSKATEVHSELCLISIIVPVHNAFEDCRRCLESLVDNTFPPVELVVVDDGSQSETALWLESFSERHPHVVLHRNSSPLGYTLAVNKAAGISSGEILVILNSDTIVPPFWLERLVAPLLGETDIVASGPVSNAATWQSVPAIKNSDGKWAINTLPDGVDVSAFDRHIQLNAASLSPEPVELLNGFCYAIRADAFYEVGGLDSEGFPSGYGEETDLFLKLASRQYRAVVNPGLFVYHAKSKSFGAERRLKLSAQGNEVLYERYGKERIASAARTLKESTALADLRSRLTKESCRPTVQVNKRLKILFLLPVAGVGGGVHSVVQEAEGLRMLGHESHVLIRKSHAELFKKSYPTQYSSGLFEIFESEEAMISKICLRDVVIATHFLSIKLLKSAAGKATGRKFMYYVQDYEPWIVPRNSKLYREAQESYTCLENTILIAKTRWICRTVQHFHGTTVKKIAPSIDHSIYQPDATGSVGALSGSLTVAAMVRPKTPRRAPRSTIKVLREIRKQLGTAVKIEVFGCSNEELSAIDGVEECGLINHGVLVREGVAEVLKRADLFIDMSKYQAFGRTALEAMACGAVAVIPIRGGGAEYAMGGRAALQVPTEDHAASATLILTLLRDKRRMTQMRSLGLQVATQFSISKAARSLEAVILNELNN